MLWFSPFQHSGTDAPAGGEGQSTGRPDTSNVADAVLVLEGAATTDGSATCSSSLPRTAEPTTSKRQGSPFLKETQTSFVHGVRGALRDRGLSQEATSIVGKAWRPATQLQYSSYLCKWNSFCSRRQINSDSATSTEVIEFLTELVTSGLSYSAVNSAKSAVITYLSITMGQDFGHNNVILQKFMKGVFAIRPALPKYSNTWDVSLVLRYLKGQSPPEALDLLALSRKLAALLLLLSGQRCQSVHSLCVDNISCLNNVLSLRFGKC